MKNGYTWNDNNPPPRKQKGMVSSKTKVKRSLGIDKLVDGPSAWRAVDMYTSGNGAVKLIREMNKLKGKAYVQAWQAVTEYFKPKLQRSFVEERKVSETTITHLITSAPPEQKQQLLLLMRQMKLTNGANMDENSNTIIDPANVLNIVPNEHESIENE